MHRASCYASLLVLCTCILLCDARRLGNRRVKVVPGGLSTLTGWPDVESPAAPSLEEATEFLGQNIEPQVARWRDRNLTPEVLEEFAKELVASPKDRRVARLALAVLRNNTLTPLQWLRGSSMYRRFECLQELIQESGLQFQDTAILMNVMDQPVCDRASLCAAPVFGTLGHKDDPDLLLPVTNHEFKLHSLPWSEKVPVAFGRAAHNYDHDRVPDGMTTRVHLAMGSKKYLQELDFGLVNVDFPDVARRHGLKKRPPVPIPDHPRWKYLVSADGVGASSRLCKLLLMNSVTLKEESPYIMYYYRSLKPWVHYVPFPSGHQAVPSLVQAVKRLQANDTLAQQISQAGQTFASKFLIPPARAWYIQQMLLSYNKLFGDGVMEAWVAQQGPEKLAAQLQELQQKKA